jgi:hypothetical protein
MAIKLEPLFFWREPAKEIFWDPFWWIILFLFILWVPFLRVWWWFFLPIMLSLQLRQLYLWWLDWDFAYASAKWKIFEITPPQENLVPMKAMEDVFNVIWPVWDGANWREKWFEGELDNTPFWCSWEIVSIEGRIHFYVRMLSQHRTMIETALYAHYPNIEIKEVDDYVNLVPPTVPNEEWNVYGEDFYLVKEPIYPLKTYEKFFEPQGERISAEEKRIDPIISLLEGMSRIGPGEQYWMQFITIPVADSDNPWRESAKNVINKITKRPIKKETTLTDDLMEMAGQVIFGPEKEGSGESAKYSWPKYEKDSETGDREMVLTPGERELTTDMESKIKKAAYKTVLRGLYIAKRENWVGSHRILARSYFAHFTQQNGNRLSFFAETRPKVHYIMRKRRGFIRTRKMFKNAILRFTPKFPDREEGCAILSTEELATLYHFPLRTTGMLAPSLKTVESKKGGPPPNLPVE